MTTKIVRIAVSAAILATAPAAIAQPAAVGARDEARALVYSGREKRATGALREALDDFERAHSLMHVPTTGLELAKTQIAVGRLLEAKVTLTEVALKANPNATEPKAFAAARAEASHLLVRMESRLPRLTIVPPDASIVATLDGEVVPPESLEAIEVNPGQHEVVFQNVRGEKRRETVVLAEGARETVRAPAITDEAPARQPRPLRSAAETSTSVPIVMARSTNPLAYVGGGLLAAGVVTGTVFGVMTLDMRSSMADRCASACGPDLQSEVESGKTYGNTSTIAFAVAGAGALLLAYGLLFPSETRSPAVGRGASPGFQF